MRQKPNSQQPSVFAASAGGLSASVGIVAAFLLAPQIYAMGAGWIGQFTGQHYGASLVEMSRLGFLAFLAYFLFHMMRLVSFSLLTTFGFWLGKAALSHARKNLL